MLGEEAARSGINWLVSFTDEVVVLHADDKKGKMMTISRKVIRNINLRIEKAGLYMVMSDILSLLSL